MKVITIIIALVLNVSVCVAAHADSAVNESRELTFTKYNEPYEPNIEPNAPSYTLPLDLNDIVNFYEVCRVVDIKGASNLIRQNGFAIVEPGFYSDMSCHDFDTFYVKLKHFRIPALVTVDVGLYLYHNLLDEVLMGIEDPALRARIFDLKNQPFTVGKYGSGAYVRGLDLMALLGSSEALKILNYEEDTEYEGYELQSGWLDGEFDTNSKTEGNSNLYWYWLYSLQALLQKVPEEYPQFIHTQAWKRHQLHACLASWTQLHDETIRQPDPTEPKYPSIPIGVTNPPLQPSPPLGCIEPFPLFWERLLLLTRMTSKKLDGLSVMTPEARGRFSLLEELIQRSLENTYRQLSNEPPSSEEHKFYKELPSTIRKLLPGAPEYGLITILASDAMGLEQAIGDIDLIIMACPISDGKTQLVIGPVLSYYEFKRSKHKRLTGETWRLMLDSPDKPDRQQWYKPLFRPTEDFPGLTRLTNNLLMDGAAHWSPDGKRIVFAGSEEEWTSDIYVLNADGTDKKNLTNNPGIYSRPCWSPDGGKIAFQSYEHYRVQIYLMNADGTDQKRLTNNDAQNAEPCWSPDGKRIAFVSDRDGNSEIYIMNADGSEQKRLTKNSVNDDNPCWSPDGKRIAFVSDRDGNSEIYVMNTDGSKQKRLTKNSANDDNPCWSPDGRQIVFNSSIGISGFQEICILDFSHN